MKFRLQYIFRVNSGWILWLAVLAGIPLLNSCEDILNVNFTGDSSQNLVVEGSITTDSNPHLVMLSYSQDYFSKQKMEMATGAEVSITDGTNTYPLVESDSGKYYTEKNVTGEVGKTYTLHIKLPDGREYSASDYLSPCNKIDSIGQSLNYNSFMSGYGYDVLFYGQEPPSIGDYYMYFLYLDGKLYSDTITEVSIASDEFVNGSYVREYQVYRIRETDLKTNPVNVTLEMYSISGRYFDFLSALKVETVWRGTPWDGPPANIPGNISNGATGFFRASDVKRTKKYFLQLDRVN